MRHLRVHQAVRRALAEVPLARPIPVIVGINECSPYYQAPYRPARTADFASAAAKRREEQQAKRHALWAQATEDVIARWREKRAKILAWPADGDPEPLQAYIRLFDAGEAVSRLGSPIAGLPHAHELDDAAFERAIEAYRRYRLA